MENIENNENVVKVENNKLYNIEDLDLKQHSFILISSKRMSGKSVFVRHLLKYFFDKYEFDVIVLFSDTAKFNEDYNFINPNLIYKTDELEQKIEKILKIQEKNIKKKKVVNMLILLDDVKVHSRSKELINLSSMGRHFFITTILSSQYPKQLVSSSIRNNLSYVFINDLGQIALKAIYESIHINMSFKEFIQYVDENNTDYKFIFYDGMIQSKNRLSLVKAKMYDNLKMVNK